jgi:hypothetical protein
LNIAVALSSTSNTSTAAAGAPSTAITANLISHREDDLDRMEACAGGDVVVGVGVVHLVQAPEQGHRMHHDVLQVDGEIHGRDRDHEGQPIPAGPGC